MKKRIRSLCSLLIIVAMITASVPQSMVSATGNGAVTPLASSTDNAQLSGGKEEIVYANLSVNGDVSGIYVVNRFEVLSSGIITDYGNYSDTRGLTNTTQIKQNDDVVTMEATPGNYYYQGTVVENNLPWTFDISYYLDGTKMEASEIAGQSGDLEIRITSQAVKGFDTSFIEQYMLQISITLDSEKSTNLVSSGATIANAGKNKTIVHTVMPGKDADITLNATVQNFEMSGIQIAAMPFSTGIDMPDTDDMLDDMTTLTDAIAALNDGVYDLKAGVNDLNSGVGDLVTGSSYYATGLAQLNGNSSQLTSGSSGIQSALNTITTSLSNSGEDMDLGELEQLPAGLRQMATGLNQMATGLTQLRDGYDTMFGALDNAMVIPSVSDGDIAILSAVVAAMDDADPNKSATGQALTNMLDSYVAAQTAQGTYMGIREGMSSVSGNLTAIVDGDGTADNPGLIGIVATLNDLADTIETALSGSDMMEQIQQLSQGIATLSEQYGTFHTGLIEYTDGVAQLSLGYSELHNGLTTLSDGTDELSEGVGDLYEGTTELKDETADLPDTIQVEINKLMEDYDVGDYVPVSYSSSKNVNISAVQFVITTEAINIPDVLNEIEEIPVEQSFWDRLLALFRK